MKRNTFYRAAAHAGFTDEQAERYGRFLAREAQLGKRPGSAERIVELAQPARSPIHEAFQWDNDAAAHEYRLEQARHLCRHIVIVNPAHPEGPPTRAFHHVETQRGAGYVSARVVWRTPTLAAQVVDNARRELVVWTTRYAEYQELAQLIVDVQKALAA